MAAHCRSARARWAAHSLVTISSAVLLSACQHVPPAPPATVAEPAPAASPVAAPLREWEGRMSIKLDAHEGREPEGLSLAFHLQLQGEAGQLSLMTPLGTQMAEIRWDAQQAVLRDSEGEQQYPSLEELSAALLGEVLPLAVLPYWLDGQADPATPSTPSPQAEGFEQLGWQIDLSGQARDLIVARRPASVEQRGITLRARLLH